MKLLPIALATIGLTSCMTTTNADGEKDLSKTADALLPYRFGSTYRTNGENEYSGMGFGLFWGLDWEAWMLNDDD